MVECFLGEWLSLQRPRRISGRTDLGAAAPGDLAGTGSLVERPDRAVTSHPDNKSTEMSSAVFFSVHVPSGGARRHPQDAAGLPKGVPGQARRYPGGRPDGPRLTAVGSTEQRVV